MANNQKVILDNKALEDIDLNTYLPKSGGTLTGRIYGNSGNGLEIQSLNTGSWKEGLRIYDNSSNNFSTLALTNLDTSDVFAMVHNGVNNWYYFDVKVDGKNYQINMPQKNGTIALIEDIEELLHDTEYGKVTPKMTSNTTPWGTVSCYSSFSNGVEPYKAFDEITNDINNYWHPPGAPCSCSNGWLQYYFPFPVQIVRMNLWINLDNYRPGTFKMQGSIDGTNWKDLTNILTVNNYPENFQVISLDQKTKFHYIRFLPLTTNYIYNGTNTWCHIGNQFSFRVGEITLYGYGGYLSV